MLWAKFVRVLWLPGYDMNCVVLVVVRGTTSWLGCCCRWTCWCDVRLKVLGHVGRICLGQKLRMLVVAWCKMAWFAEAEAADGPMDATCNLELLSCHGDVGLQRFGWAVVSLWFCGRKAQLKVQGRGGRRWCGQMWIIFLVTGYNMAWVVGGIVSFTTIRWVGCCWSCWLDVPLVVARSNGWMCQKMRQCWWPLGTIWKLVFGFGGLDSDRIAGLWLQEVLLTWLWKRWLVALLAQ